MRVHNSNEQYWTPPFN